MDITCENRNQLKQDTIKAKLKTPRKRLTMNKRRRVAYQHDTNRPKPVEKLVSCQQQYLSNNEKSCQIVTMPTNLLNFNKYANNGQDLKYPQNLLYVEKTKSLQGTTSPCFNSQSLSSETKFEITNQNEIIEPCQVNTNGNSNFNIQTNHEPSHHSSHHETNGNLNNIHKSGIFVEHKMSSNVSDVLGIPNRNDETFINITNEPPSVPVPSQQFSKSSFVSPHYTNFPIQSSNVFQNYNYSVPIQVIQTNNQAPVYQYVYVPNFTYVTWQNVHYYSDQQVMYTVPGVYYMLNTIQPIVQPSSYSNNTTTIYHEANTSSILPDHNQQYCDQHLYLAEQQSQNHQVHHHQLLNQQPMSSAPYDYNFMSHESQVQNEAKYSQFEHTGEKPMHVHIDNTIDTLTKVEDLNVVSDEPLELKDLYKNPCFDTLSRSSTSLNNTEEE